jgi:hypothetical protein
LKSFLLEVVYAEHYDEQNIEDDAKNGTVEKMGKFREKKFCFAVRYSPLLHLPPLRVNNFQFVLTASVNSHTKIYMRSTVFLLTRETNLPIPV